MPNQKPRPSTRAPAPESLTEDNTLLQMYTPAEAAEKLSVKESWLRRKAGTRSIPCTFLGKHLRFSENDLHDIIRLARTTATNHWRR